MRPSRIETYCKRPQAGPLGTTSEMTMVGSPEVKCGLSLPPEIAIPKPTDGV